MKIVSQSDAARILGISRQAIRKRILSSKLHTVLYAGRLHVVIEFKENAKETIMSEEELKRVRSLIREFTTYQKEILFNELKSQVSVHPLETEFGVGSEVIMEAIARSSDLTKRGVRGVIAEAVFKHEILDVTKEITDLNPDGNFSYDFLVNYKGHQITIQVKMQRQKAHRPMTAKEGWKIYRDDYWVVETQRTRGGKDSKTEENTRPYKFGEFDLIAVSLQPSTGNWSDFLITSSRYLIADKNEKEKIAKFQPVPKTQDQYWKSSIIEAVEEFLSKRVGTIKGTA